MATSTQTVEDRVPSLKKTHGRDFSIWYDTTLKRHFWTMGYFGGGAINIQKALNVAQEYAKLHNVPLESVVVDEIQHSRRYKHFKVFYSDIEQEKIEGIADYMTDENIWGRLTD